MTAISVQHDAHRKLRVPLDKLFARHNIRRMEPRMVARVERLGARLREFAGGDQVVNLTNAFSSLTTDAISSTIFQEPSDYLGDPEFNDAWYDTLKHGTKSVPLFKHLPAVVGYDLIARQAVPWSRLLTEIVDCSRAQSCEAS
jgi:cytochrome P450